MRRNIEVKEMRSGEDDDLLWVSLGFESELSEYDVLFIVCGKEVDEQDRKLGMDGLYFERLDQINSCYNAAEHITVSEDALDIDFTGEGGQELKFPKIVRFECRRAVSDFGGVREVLRKMAGHEWAKAIRFA